MAPLFVHTNGEAWTVPQTRGLFKASGAAIGIDTKHLGAQSGRIGGATDLFSVDASPAMLQICGRW